MPIQFPLLSQVWSDRVEFPQLFLGGKFVTSGPAALQSGNE